VYGTDGIILNSIFKTITGTLCDIYLVLICVLSVSTQHLCVWSIFDIYNDNRFDDAM